MIVKPTVTELLTKANNRYELVIATARRARQISQEKKEEGKDRKVNHTRKWIKIL